MSFRLADDVSIYPKFIIHLRISGQPGAQPIFTDDVHLQIFFHHLKKYGCIEFLADYRLAVTGAS